MRGGVDEAPDDDDDNAALIVSTNDDADDYERGSDDAMYEGADAVREFYFGGYTTGGVDAMFDDDEPGDTAYEFDESQSRRTTQ